MESRAEILDSLRRVATWNGGSICLIAALGALLASGWTVSFALAVALAGLVEVWGGRRVAQAPAPGVRLLVASQAGIILLIGGYAAWRFLTIDAAAVLAELEQVYPGLLAAGSDQATLDLLQRAFRIMYGVIFALTVIYQGGMAWYYSRSVRRALALPGN